MTLLICFNIKSNNQDWCPTCFNQTSSSVTAENMLSILWSYWNSQIWTVLNYLATILSNWWHQFDLKSNEVINTRNICWFLDLRFFLFWRRLQLSFKYNYTVTIVRLGLTLWVGPHNTEVMFDRLSLICFFFFFDPLNCLRKTNKCIILRRGKEHAFYRFCSEKIKWWSRRLNYECMPFQICKLIIIGDKIYQIIIWQIIIKYFNLR